MKLKAGSFCPLIKKDCIELKCALFTQLRGHNPNTGEEIDDWGCAVGWLPVLLVENSQQQRSTGAAVESFRNETISRISTTINMKKIEKSIDRLEGDIDQ